MISVNTIYCCPHCGAQPSTRSYSGVHYEVFCTNVRCNAKVWSEVDMKDAIKRWNKRIHEEDDDVTN